MTLALDLLRENVAFHPGKEEKEALSFEKRSLIIWAPFVVNPSRRHSRVKCADRCPSANAMKVGGICGQSGKGISGKRSYIQVEEMSPPL